MHLFQYSSDTYIKLIDTYTKNGALKSGKTLHAHLIVNGLVSSYNLVSKLIIFYTQCKQLSNAQNLFDKIPHSNIRCFVVAIGSYARHGYYQEAMDAFEKMRREGFHYDMIVLPSVLKACSQLSDRKTGEKLHAIVLKNEFETSPFVLTGLINMYSKCGFVKKARRVFDSMVEKDLVALNAMVSGYVQNDVIQEAIILVNEMKLFGVKPDIVTWNTLISGFSQKNDMAMVEKVFRIMEASGLKPDVISWSSVISGLVQNFQNLDTFSAFRKMLRAGLLPSPSTISSLLPAAANIADLRHGKEIHGYSVAMGFSSNLYVRSALIDMYAKCGLISEAMSIFRNMSEKNTVSWNSMIFGYANNGYSHEAIELFNQMLKEDGKKLKPDHLTFTGALMACSHGGMIDLGERLFYMMQEKYDIVPRPEHYACVVDLLGRAGKVVEAYGFIERMPIEPDLFVWGALLGACKQYGFVDLGEIAAKEVARLEPESAGSGVLLSSLYSESNRWENVASVKKMMKKRKLRSFPGCSWIEVV